tara:strand:- start:42 stop:260 length:219 start_codon:yes stop_codon:yes gene_type:complete
MSKNIRNWEDWDEIEDESKEKEVRDKINHKPKQHDINEWHKVEKELNQKGNKKYVKNKRRKDHQISKKNPNR